MTKFIPAILCLDTPGYFTINNDPDIIIKNFYTEPAFTPGVFIQFILPAALIMLLLICTARLISPSRCKNHAAAYSVCTPAAVLSLTAYAVIKNISYLVYTNNITSEILEFISYSPRRFLLSASVFTISACAGIASFSLFLRVPLRIRVLFPSIISLYILFKLSASFPEYTLRNTVSLTGFYDQVRPANQSMILPLIITVTAVCLITERYDPDENFRFFRNNKFIFRKFNFKKRHSA